VTFKRKGSPFYQCQPVLPGFGRIGPFSTGTRDKSRADAMDAMLFEFATSRPSLIQGLNAKKYTLPDLYVAKLRGTPALKQLLARGNDPLLSEVVDRFRKTVKDERVLDGLDQLLEHSPAVARQYDEWRRDAKNLRFSFLKSPKHITELYAEAMKTRSSGSVRRSLHRAVSDLLAHELGKAGKAAIMVDVKIPKQAPSRDVRMSKEEVRAVISKCDEEFIDIVLAAMLTGIDVTPLVEQRAADFSDEHGTVRVPDNKTPDRPRVLELSSAAWYVYRRAAAGKKPGDKIFPFTRHQVTRRWEVVRTEANVPNVRFKDLRHVLATAMEEAGASVKEIMLYLGHSNPETTLDYLGAPRINMRGFADGAANVLGLDRLHLKVESA
jgi:integrase